MRKVVDKSRKNKRKCKTTTPDAITKPGSYPHIININIINKNWPHVLDPGSVPTTAPLDSRKFLHKTIYNRLLTSCNDITNNFICGFAYPEVKHFQLVGVYKNTANDFVCISSADLNDAMGYLNFNYKAAHKQNKSSRAV